MVYGSACLLSRSGFQRLAAQLSRLRTRGTSLRLRQEFQCRVKVVIAATEPAVVTPQFSRSPCTPTNEGKAECWYELPGRRRSMLQCPLGRPFHPVFPHIFQQKGTIWSPVGKHSGVGKKIDEF